MRGFDLYPGAKLVDYTVLNYRDEKLQEEECQRRNHAIETIKESAEEVITQNRPCRAVYDYNYKST